MTKRLTETGGVGGVQLDTREGSLSPPTPPLDDANFERALRTVREATREEITAIRGPSMRTTILRAQAGEPVHKWAVRTAASFLDDSPDERGQDARENRDLLIAEITKTHDRLSVCPGPVEIEKDYHETRAEYEERCRLIEAEGPPPPDPTLVAKHAQHCARYPWITFYLGYRTSPVEIPDSVEPPRPVKPPRDRFTAMSIRKARERARTRGTLIDPRWEASAEVMYLDVVAEIGTCPPMVDADGQRVFTLDRYPKPKRGYVPGNIRWANKSEQRDNR